MDFEEKIAVAQLQEGVKIGGNNPARNRDIEREELKKGCLSLWTDFDFHITSMISHNEDGKPPNNYPEIIPKTTLEVAPSIQFLEQAFDWDNMTYEFYPFYWGRKKNWLEVYSYEDNDPLFVDFLKAGAARVLVPVKVERSEEVLYYQLTGKLHPGEVIPSLTPTEPDSTFTVNPNLDNDTIDNEAELFNSYLEDLADVDPDADIQKDVDILPDDPDTWLIKVPTTLVWLQSEGAEQQLPNFEE